MPIMQDAPMAYFNPSRPSYLEDPYPSLARLRREKDVYRSAELQLWVVTTYEGSEQVCRDEAFSADATHARARWADFAADTAAHTVLGAAKRMSGSDKPDHERLRRVVGGVFSPRAMGATRTQLEALATRLLDEVGDGDFDFAALARTYVGESIMAHLGVPPADREQLGLWSRTVILAARMPDAPRAAAEACAGLAEYLRGTPTDGHEAGALELIAAAERDGQITEAEMVGLAADLVVAGYDASVGLLTNGVHALVTHPHEYVRVRTGEAAAPIAVEELLRFDAPVQAVFRFARRETVLGSVRIPAGDGVVAMLGAGNRDPAKFPDPDRLDVTRDDGRPLSFSLGAHHCIGASLARAAAAVMIEALTRRFPLLRVSRAQSAVRRADWLNRSFTALPLSTTAAG